MFTLKPNLKRWTKRKQVESQKFSSDIMRRVKNRENGKKKDIQMKLLTEGFEKIVYSGTFMDFICESKEYKKRSFTKISSPTSFSHTNVEC